MSMLIGYFGLRICISVLEKILQKVNIQWDSIPDDH